MRKTTIGIVLAATAAFVSTAWAGSMSATPMHVAPIGLGNYGACTAGFSTGTTIDPSQPYNQSYVCTAGLIVCSPGFAPVVVYLPAQGQGELLGPVSPASPIAMKNGHPIYTCQGPSAPPR